MLWMLRRAARPLLYLTLLGSLLLAAGCGERMPELPAPPRVFPARDCPAPERPVLPPVDGTLPFDAPENITALMRRDTILKHCAEGLEAAVDCYRKAKKEVSDDARGANATVD